MRDWTVSENDHTCSSILHIQQNLFKISYYPKIICHCHLAENLFDIIQKLEAF